MFRNISFVSCVSELSFQNVSFVLYLFVSERSSHNFCFGTFRFRTEAVGTSELRLGEPGAGGSHLQGRPGEPKSGAGGTGAAQGRYRRIKEIESVDPWVEVLEHPFLKWFSPWSPPGP